MQKIAFWALLSVLVSVFGLVLFQMEQSSMAKHVLKTQVVDHDSDTPDLVLEQIGEDLAKRMVWVVGIDPTQPYQTDLVDQLVHRAKQKGVEFEAILVDKNLGVQDNASEEIEYVDFKNSIEAVGKKASELTKSGKRVLIRTVNVFSSAILEGGPTQKLNQMLETDVLSLSLLEMAIGREHERDLNPPCSGLGRNQMGTAELGCRLLKKSRMATRHYHMNKWTEDQSLASLEQYGTKDFLLFVKN